MSSVINVLNNVDHISDFDSGKFIDEYVNKQKPVVIDKGFSESEIAKFKSQAAFIGRFGDLTIKVQENYTSSIVEQGGYRKGMGLSGKVRNKPFDMSLKAYCEHISEDPNTNLLCVEFPTPKQVYDVVGGFSLGEELSRLEDIVSFLFVANKGNYAHLHFDGDFRNVLLYQVYGRKRVVMVPFESLNKIMPSMNFSKLCIQNNDEEEKLGLLRYLNAYDCIIEPGQSIYFPPSIWHYVEYIDDGMSVNFRFGRDEFSKRVVDANRNPFYPELHKLLYHLKNEHDPVAKEKKQQIVWERLGEALTTDYESTKERHLAIHNLYETLINSLFQQNDKASYMMPKYCSIAEEMAVERYENANKAWREELALGEPI